MIYYGYIGSVSRFMKFGGQTSNNVLDVKKVCLETILCVLTYFVDFAYSFLMKLM